MLPIHEDMWILYRNKIPVHKIKLAEKVPNMNPLGVKYKRWWKREKRKCIEGHWAEHEGVWKWSSGPLYYFVNFHKILLTPKNTRSMSKRLGLPFLRDLEWIRSFIHEEARGFSGFEDDDNYSCHRLLEEFDPVKEADLFNEMLMEYAAPDLIKASITKKDGSFKEYKSAREYLYEYKSENLGKAQYFNMMSNIVDLESRGGGKSYWAAAILNHNFLFDGATNYEDYLEYKANKEPLSSESLVGAIDTKYTNDLISKMRLAMDNLPGKVLIGKTTYPSPFHREYYGDWKSGGTITTGYDKKIGGLWTKIGTKSKIQHRSFNANHKAANGTRPSLALIDEVGFMDNLIAVLGQMKEAAADGTVKSGQIWMTGTGGDMVGGATEEVKQVFYSPEAFDCLAFDDEYEGYVSKIGFFVPTWMTLNQFKDDMGNTNWELACKYIDRKREKLKKDAKKKEVYENEIVQRPMVHSEVFLLANNSILPTIDLKEHMDKLVAMQDEPEIKGMHGWMMLDEEGSPYFKFDPKNFKPTDYPVKLGKAHDGDKQGAVVIWEKPDEDAQYGWYCAGNDPYDFDIAPNSVSLGSVFVIKRGTPFNGGFDRIVAEYTGRPTMASDFYEQVRRLLMHYGDAVCLYENEKQHIKEHFKKMYSLNLLAYTPGVLKANETSKTAQTRVYGQHMSPPIKKEIEIYLREWLLSPIGDGKLQLHTIKSIPLLKELIAYNPDGNFDRVIALMLAIIQLIQMRSIVVETKAEEIESQKDDFFNRKLFTGNMGSTGLFN